MRKEALIPITHQDIAYPQVVRFTSFGMIPLSPFVKFLISHRKSRIKMGIVKWLSFLTVILVSLNLSAQNDSVSGKTGRFFRQLSASLLNTKSQVNLTKANALLARFNANLSANRFTVEEQRSIWQIAKQIQSKRLRPYPYLYDYLYNINLLAETHRTPEEFRAWQRYADEQVKSRKLYDFSHFLDFSKNLLERHILYKKATASWHFRRADFVLHYDTAFYVRFSHLNLVKASHNDSIMIMQTRGTFVYPSSRWKGEGGRLVWNRFATGWSEKYTIADSYHFSLNTNVINIDSVVLTFPERLGKQAVTGRLTDRVLTGKPGENSVYPRFVSYDSRIFIPEIYPQVSFRGGVELEGKNLYGVSINSTKPEIIFKLKNEPVVTLYANRFTFGKDKLTSSNTSARIFLNNDSIYHPRLTLRYDVPDKRLQLYTLSDIQIPFFDSYHKMDLYVPALVWNLKADSIIFKKLRGINDKQPARFESDRYFNVREFYELQGIDELNPLYVVQNFMKMYSTQRISVAALSAFMNKSPDQAEDLLMRLSNKGFVAYDAETKTAVATKRLQYFLDAKAGRTDYDVIHFNSEEKLKPNASLNLKNLSLNIYGVSRIFISDSQQVYIYPYNKKIAVHKNRDFTFSGKVNAGLFHFYARKSTFVYDSFLINMNYVDSLAFGVWKKDTIRNRRYVMPVKQPLQKLTGKLYVDLPFNKSGLLHVPQYPKFTSESECYVYYNRPPLQDSTLLPGRFFYRVSPFVFDSLMTFKTDGLAFQGSLVSDSIFPPISQPLRVMPDYALGFVYRTSPGGLPAYGGKAQYFDTLTLDMKGFHGSGTLHYLTTSVQAKDFRFYPDSLLAQKARYFKGKTDSTTYHFPSVQCDSVTLAWNTDTNVMQVKSAGPSFKMYGNSLLKGSITLSPERFTGKGHYAFGHADISSHHFLFTDRSLNADSANFILKNPDTGDTTFVARNYRAQIDFGQQKGWFTHLNKNSFLTFPFNRYISTLDEVEWLIDQDKLSLSSTRNEVYARLDSLNRKQLTAFHLPGPEFISILPEDDSLRFYAQKAFYNIGQYTIDAEGVKLIKTADAAVFPGNEAVTILQKGKLAPLEGADILTDTAHFYHNIYDARVQILSRKSYTASGKLDYKDMNGTVQPIAMTDVHVDSAGHTVAVGAIPKGEIFFLSPEYFFTGKVIMHAGDPLLHFRGGYQLNEDCVDNTGNWMAVDQDLDPNHIAFRFSKSSKTADSLPALFGLAYSFQYHNYYPLVLQALKSPSDEVLVSATGNLTINQKSGSFVMTTEERLKNNDLQPNRIELDSKNCQLKGDGIFNLGMKNHMFKTKCIGTFRHLVVRDSTLLHVVLMMKFYFDADALNMMADSLRMIPSKSVNITKGIYPLALEKLLGHQGAKEVLTSLSLYGQQKKMPEALNNTLTFTDLHLVWDPMTRSFISYGPIGIGHVGNNTLNKYLDGIVQIRKGRSGATIEFMLRHGKRQYYYFNYANGILQVLSSDLNFNDLIENQKEDKRVLNPNSDTDYYEYVLTTRTRAVNFLRALKRAGRLK